MFKMHKEEIIAIAAFLFLVVLMGLFYFDSYSNITGAAILNSGKRDIVFGIYSIKPSFKVDVSYDLDDYNKIRNLLEPLLECLKLGKGIELCMKEAESKDNEFEWSLDCDKGAEKVLYELAEFYQSCIEANDNDCLCRKNLELSKEEIEKLELSNNKYEMTLTEDVLNKKIIIKMKEPEIDLSYGINTKDVAGWFPNRYIIAYTTDLQLNMFFVGGVSGDISSLGPLKEIVIYKNQRDKRDYSDFVKESDDMLEYSIPSRNIKKPEGLHECRLKSKNAYKFCIVKKDFSLTAYSKSDNKIKPREIIYKFALRIKLIPKPIEKLEIFDAKKAENSVILVWGKPKESDAKSYSIYYSKKDFTDIKIDDIKKDEFIKEISGDSPIEIEDINLADCIFEPIGESCKYKIFNKKLEKNKLYYWKSKDKFIYLIDDVADGVEHYFAVTAVNDEGIEIDNDKSAKENTYIFTLNKNYQKFSPVDDLAPNKAEKLGKEITSDGKTKLVWNKPIKNMDGSASIDTASFNIYYKKSTAAIAPQLELGYNIKTITTKDAKCDNIVLACEYFIDNLNLEKGQNHNFAVTALDEKSNEFSANADFISIIMQ